MNDAMLSRVADNLYWMSRYLERAEHTSRLLAVHLNMALDQSPAQADERWQRLLSSLYVPAPKDTRITDYSVTQLLTFDPENDNSIMNCIATARENARHVREQVSSEMWEQLNRLYLRMRSANIDAIWDEEPDMFLSSVREGVHLFDGVTDSTMNHGEGWYFIQAGRYIERVYAIARLLDIHSPLLSPPRNGRSSHNDRDNYLDWVGILKCCTAFEAYCKIHTAYLTPNAITEFLLLNTEFPHSIGFAVDRLQVALDAIADKTDKRKGIRANRLVGRLSAALSYDPIDEIMASDLHHYLREIQNQCGQIHTAIQQTYITYQIDSALNS